MKKIVLTIFYFFIFSAVHSQTTQNYFEIRLKNDNAGELSNWLNTGDDLGETHSFLVAVNIQNKHPKYNFGTTIESTEYALLDTSMLEPRDILFTELNNFQLCFDNNKFQNKTFFFSIAPGMLYIQSNNVNSIGATGQKYYAHKLISKSYADRYWIYNSSHKTDYYIPYIGLKYGYNKNFIERSHFSIRTISNVECQLSADHDYTGIGAKSYIDLRFTNERFKMNAIDIEMEGYYLTNIDYQIANFQIGLKLNCKRFAVYTQINKPIKKNLNNPYIVSNDMEILFNYGVVFIL